MKLLSNNVIKEIKDGNNLEKYLLDAKFRLLKDGATNISVLEILSYFKVFHPEVFSSHESDVLEMMGLFYKQPKPNSLIGLMFEDYGKYIKDTYGEDFTPIQADIIRKINTNQTFTFSAPTSTGKSFVFRELIKNANFDVVIIVPSRALINEYYDRIFEIIDEKVTNVLTFVDIINTKFSKRNIFILTPERARELFKKKQRLNIGLILFDEAQLSDEDSIRGLYFDSIVQRAKKNFPNAKFVFSHPFIENPEAQLRKLKIGVEINFNAVHYKQKNIGQIFCSYNKDLNEFYHFGIDKTYIGSKKITTDYDPISKSILDGGSVLIFVSKSNIYNGRIFEDFKKYIDLCNKIENQNANKLIDQLQNYVGASNGDNSNYESNILNYLKKGIVIHHGSIPLRARTILEHFTQQGFCRICFATSTLEQGINMPFDVVFLDKFIKSSPLSIKNLIGRAGRSTLTEKFDVGTVIVKHSNMSDFRKIMLNNEKISEISHLDKEVKDLDEKYSEFKEAIKNDNFNDEYNLSNKDVKRLSSSDISIIVKNLLDMMFDENNVLVYPKWESDDKNQRKDMYDLFHKLYQQYLGERELTVAEKSILSQAFKIMMWRVNKRSFKLICQYRFDYASRKKERSREEEVNESLAANFLKGYDDIPNKNLKNYSLFHNLPANLVDYDRIIYDTYDYLDKLIGFKLSDIYYAVFNQHYKLTEDSRAQELANLLKYGTNNEKEIWMLKYGLTFEDIEWAASSIDSISEQEIVFNENYQKLSEDQKSVLKQFYH